MSEQFVATCETNGHIFMSGKCLFCKIDQPPIPEDRYSGAAWNSMYEESSKLEIMKMWHDMWHEKHDLRAQLAIERQNVKDWTQTAAVHEAGVRALELQVVRLKEALQEAMPYAQNFVDVYISSRRGSDSDRDGYRSMLRRLDAALADSPEPQKEPES